jgi:hypothetical protein
VKGRESRALVTLAQDPCAGTPGNEGEISSSQSSFSLPVLIRRLCCFFPSLSYFSRVVRTLIQNCRPDTNQHGRIGD